MDVQSLGAMFCNGDLDRRRRHVGQYFVLNMVRDNPVRAVGVYRHLIRWHGQHAADLFYEYLGKPDHDAWYHLVAMTRPVTPLPG